MTDQSPAGEELILFAEHLCLGMGEKQPKQKVMYRSLTDTKWVDLGTTTSLNDALDWNIEPPKLR